MGDAIDQILPRLILEKAQEPGLKERSVRSGHHQALVRLSFHPRRCATMLINKLVRLTSQVDAFSGR